MERIYHSHWTWAEKAAVGVGLLALSGALYFIDILILGQPEAIAKHFLLKFAFLPIHALVLGIILEEVLSLRERFMRRKKLNFFLGIFFRQMGVDFYVAMVELVKNRDELEQITTVQPSWGKKQFKAARQNLQAFELKMMPEAEKLEKVFQLLHDRENDIVAMTRNPNLWEYEQLYRGLMALFHLLEERRFHGSLHNLPPAAIDHLGKDVSKAVIALGRLWLVYLEHLKQDHPVLFRYQTGICNTVQPMALEEQ